MWPSHQHSGTRRRAHRETTPDAAPHSGSLPDAADKPGPARGRQPATAGVAAAPERQPDLVHAVLVTSPRLAAWVLAHHADDGAGLCAACTGPAPGRRHGWPCALHDAAHRAREIEIAAARDTPARVVDLDERVRDRWYARP